MGDSLCMLGGQLEIPVCPVGKLARDGWLPCTFVKLVPTPPSVYSGAIAAVDRSDGTGMIAGLLATGPQHNQPVEKMSDMWTTDIRQREGGETRADWGPIDAANVLVMDSNGLLDRVGTSVVTMAGGSDGIYKTYVFERKNLAERTNPGTGSDLLYKSGDLLYVSGNGLLTNEKESPAHVFLGYAVYKYGHDNDGDYVFFATAMAFA